VKKTPGGGVSATQEKPWGSTNEFLGPQKPFKKKGNGGRGGGVGGLMGACDLVEKIIVMGMGVELGGGSRSRA